MSLFPKTVPKENWSEVAKRWQQYLPKLVELNRWLTAGFVFFVPVECPDFGRLRRWWPRLRPRRRIYPSASANVNQPLSDDI